MLIKAKNSRLTKQRVGAGGDEARGWGGWRWYAEAEYLDTRTRLRVGLKGARTVDLGTEVQYNPVGPKYTLCPAP